MVYAVDSSSFIASSACDLQALATSLKVKCGNNALSLHTSKTKVLVCESEESQLNVHIAKEKYFFRYKMNAEEMKRLMIVDEVKEVYRKP